MSKINDLLIQAEESQNNDERLAWYREKLKQYQKYLYPTQYDWFDHQDRNNAWIKEKEKCL